MMQGALEDITKAVGNTPIVRLNRVDEGRRRRDLRQVRVPEPGRQPQGSRRARTCSGAPRRRASSPAARSSRRRAATPARRSRCSPRSRATSASSSCPTRCARRRSRTSARSARASSCARPPSSPTIRAATTRSSRRIADETPNCFYANQYHNPANPEAHYLSTGPGDLGADAAASSTSSSPAWARAARSAAPASTSRRRSPSIKIVGVDPVGSLYYDFVKTRPHHEAVLVQGRGHRRGLLPDDDEPQDPRRHRPRRRQGVLPDDARSRRASRASSSAARAARRSRARSSTRRAAARRQKHPRLPAATRGQKYVSKIFNDDWMRENGFLDEAAGPRHRRATSCSTRGKRKIVTARADVEGARRHRRR